MLEADKTRNFVRQSGIFSTAAQVMGDMVLRCCKTESPELYMAMVLAAQYSMEKHICVQLAECGGTVLTGRNNDLQLTLPEYNTWREILKNDSFREVIAVLDKPVRKVPDTLLVLDCNGGCYLQRQWSFERSVEKALLERAAAVLPLPKLDAGELHGIVSFFPDAEHHPAIDYQQLAVLAAQRHKLTVLSGGPGTGKTTVATAVLALKLKKRPDMRILLAAPTAKAALRLEESIQKNLQYLSRDIDQSGLQELRAATIHRVLGVKLNDNEFKHNSDNPLDCDLLLIDECSMVPLNLMARAVEALPPHAELILLGDRYQLASVEAGSVLADICDSARANVVDPVVAECFKKQTAWSVDSLGEIPQESALDGCLIELCENHRFDSDAPLLGKIAGIIRNLQSNDNFATIAEDIASCSGREFKFMDANERELEKIIKNKLDQPRLVSGEKLSDLPELAACASEENLARAFALLNSYKLLAPGYQGPRGIHQLNNICMKHLKLKDLYSVGVPLLIKSNDYRTGLFNGDIGLVGMDEHGRKKVFFENNGHAFNIADLPEHEAVFAMSVHKAQGCGFGEVVFVMPRTGDALMTREMVYTAMTRAEKQLLCIGSTAVFAEALQKVTRRMSNLSKYLKQASQ